MREIKFRFWDKENKKMIYGAEETYDYGASGIPIMEDNFGLLLKNSGECVMQYVGVKDENGVEVYEGDIIRKRCEYNRQTYECWYEVIYEQTGFYLKIVNYSINTNDDVKVGVVVSFPYGDFYVVGNIYQNKELMETSK